MSLKTTVVKNLPTILTVCGVVGTIGTVVTARQDTLRAEAKLAEARRKLLDEKYDIYVQAKKLSKQNKSDNAIAEELHVDKEEIVDILQNDIDTMEKAKIYATSYIPTTLMAGVTVACIVGSNHASKQQLAALAGMYALSQANLNEYKDKVKEFMGEEKAQEITDGIIGDRIRNNPPTPSNTEPLGMTNGVNLSMWYDVYSDRYFYSSSDRIRRAELDAQEMLNQNHELSINDIYGLLGLRENPAGEVVGWTAKSNPTVHIKRTSIWDSNIDEPIGAIVMNYSDGENAPNSDWLSLG